MRRVVHASLSLSLSLSLVGCGLFLDEASPAVTITPGEVDFGMIAIGSSSARTTFVVSADRPTELGPIDIDEPEDYDVVSTTCDAELSGPGDACIMSVEFTPQFAAPRPATLSIAGASATLDGFGFSPGKISLDPGALSFGDVGAGTTSQPEAVTVTNISDETFERVDLAVLDPETFAARSTGCVGLEPGASCELEVSFQPPRLGAVVSSVTVLGYIGGTPEIGVLSVSGNGALTQHPITVTIDGLGRVSDSQGFIDCQPDIADKCSAQVDFGVAITLTAEPELSFQTWGDACAAESTAVCELLIDGPKDVSASFGPASPAISP